MKKQKKQRRNKFICYGNIWTEFIFVTQNGAQGHL